MIAQEEVRNALVQSLLSTALDPNHRGRFRAVEAVRLLLAESDAALAAAGPLDGGVPMMLGQSPDEYLRMLHRVIDRQDVEIYDDPDDAPPDLLERRARLEKAEAALRANGLDPTEFDIFVRRDSPATGEVS